MPGSILTFRPPATQLALDNGHNGFAVVDVEAIDFGDGVTGTQASIATEDNGNPNQPQSSTVVVASRSSDSVDGEESFVRIQSLDGDHQVNIEITPANSREVGTPPTIDLSFCDSDIAATAGAIVAYLRVIVQSTPTGLPIPAGVYKIPLYAVS
jgi:hypothetical protein